MPVRYSSPRAHRPATLKPGPAFEAGAVLVRGRLGPQLKEVLIQVLGLGWGSHRGTLREALREALRGGGSYPVSWLVPGFGALFRD